MGTGVDPAYIERLQEDIIIACHRLEENGHESMVVTVSKEGHLIFGSEKGKKFLEDRHVFIMDFIQFCQTADKPVLIKVETDQEDHEVKKPNGPKNSFKQLKQSCKSINKDIAKSKNNCHNMPDPPATTVVEAPDVFEGDTDDCEDMEDFDITSVSKMDSEIDQISEDTPLKTEAVVIKKESQQHDSREKPKHIIEKMPEARIVLDKITDIIINSSQKSDLRSRKSNLKTSEVGKEMKKDTPSCDICGKELATWGGVKRHKICFHQDKWDYQCDVCNKKFKTQENVTKHKVIHSAPEHKCQVCDKAFTTVSYLKKHMVVHSTEKSSICAECGKGFGSQSYLDKHKVIHTGLKPYKCQVCEYRTCNAGNFGKHVKLHAPGKPFTCEDCGKSFRLKVYLKNHKNIIHGPGKPFKCDVCGSSFNDQLSLRNHLRKHKNMEEFKCKVCGKQCACKSKLLRHMGCHKDGKMKKKKSYTCEVCGKQSSCQGNLDKHMIQHTNQKPYVCEICGKTYAAKQHLENHVRLHTGEKPFKCTFQGCNMTFRTYENHRKHMCYHSDDYPFICDFCGQKFKEKSCMRHHRKKHTIAYRWPCDYCPEKFSTLVRFKTHIVRVHVDKRDKVSERTNIKFWPCDRCSKVFGAKEDYTQHMNVHLGRKPYKCELCGKAFSSKSNQLQHRKSHYKYNTLKCSFCYKSYSDPKRLKEHLTSKHGQNIEVDGAKNELTNDLHGTTQETKDIMGSIQVDQSGKSTPSQLLPIAPRMVAISSFINPVLNDTVSGLNPLRIEDISLVSDHRSFDALT